MKFASTYRRIPLWGRALPVIAATAGAVVVAAVAGITGDNPVKVQEPVTFVVSSTRVVDSTGTVEAVIYNDNTSMIVSAQTYPGESYTIELALKNESSIDQAQRILVTAPEGFRFSDATTTDPLGVISVAQEGTRSFVYQLDDAADGSKPLVLTVEVLPQVIPGWYTLSIETEGLPTTTNFD